MEKTLFTFIRSANGMPVGGIAYQLDLAHGKMEYELSRHNTNVDDFDRDRARQVAEGRLNKHPKTFTFNPATVKTAPLALRALARELLAPYAATGWKPNKGDLSKKVFRALTEYLIVAEKNDAAKAAAKTVAATKN